MSKVSVVILSYNHREFIGEAIDSVLAQRGVDLQVVVADDGSGDGTQEIVVAYAERFPAVVVPVLSPVNTGIADNFNRGIAAATGELLAWLGGDDVMLPGKLAAQAEWLAADRQAIGCYTDAEVFEHPGNRVLGRFSGLYAGGRFPRIDARKFLSPATQMLPSSIMVRRTALPVHGFDRRFRVLNDYLFDFETLAGGGYYAGIPTVYVRYRKHAGSVGRTPEFAAKIFEEKLMVCAAIMARHPEYAAAARRRLAYYALEEAMKMLRAGNRRQFSGLCGLAAANGDRARAWLAWLLAPLAIAVLYGPGGQRLRSLARRVLFR